jgi:hypothetical protein
MPSRPERGLGRSPYRLAAYGLLSVLVLLAAIPGYLTLAPSWRPVAIRVACAVIAFTGCIRVVRGARRVIGVSVPSALDAPPPASPRPTLDERFLRLRADLVSSRRNRRYFDAILRPRLLELGGADLPPDVDVTALRAHDMGLTAPRATGVERRESRRRGPSLKTLEHLIAEIEQRP